MDEKGSGAQRPPLPPPTQPQRATPPPIRRVTATMPAVSAPRSESFSGPKPAPEPPAKNAFRENFGERAYENLKAALRAVCKVSGMSMQQFMTTPYALILRDASGQDLPVAEIAYMGGLPELRIHFSELGWDCGKEEKCSAILSACSTLDTKTEGKGRLSMLAGMADVFIRISEKEVSLCGAQKRGANSVIAFILNV